MDAAGGVGNGRLALAVEGSVFVENVECTATAVDRIWGRRVSISIRGRREGLVEYIQTWLLASLMGRPQGFSPTFEITLAVHALSPSTHMTGRYSLVACYSLAIKTMRCRLSYGCC
jgi:hypothetical protein